MSDSPSNKTSRSTFTYSAIVFFVVFFIGVSASFVWQNQQNHIQRTQAHALAQTYSYQLRSVLDHNLSGIYSLAALVHEFGGFTRWFPQVAESLHQLYPEVNNFALSPNGIVEQVYPLAGNEQAIGFNQLMDIEQGTDAWETLQQQKLILSGPVSLVQGGQGLVARYPITLEDRNEGPEQFWGFSNVVIRVDALLKNAQFQALVEQGFAYRLDRVDLETPLVISENNAEALVEPVVIEMSLPGVRWHLALAPESGWFPAHLWLIYGIACIGVAGLVARFVFMGLRIKEQKELLSILLTEQTEHANASDDRLNRTLMAIPDPLLEVSQTGDVINVRMPNDESELAVYFKEGESFKAHLPESVIEVFEFVFQEVLRSDTLSHRGAVFSLPINEQTQLWFEMSVVFQASPKSGESGNYVVLLRDISIRHESEQQLRIAATAFETQDGMLISDQHNRIIKVNQAFQKISGYSESEVIGQTPAILQSGRHDKSFYECMFAQLANKGTWEGEVWNKRKNGEIYPEWLSISSVQDYLGQVSHYVATFKDISERKASERQIRQLNYYDSLTRLANRTLLLEEMMFFVQEKNLRSLQSVVLFIDLDHFKDVNDVWGHNMGDQLLQQVAARLTEATRAQDIVARFGGDEFLILLEPVDISSNADRALYRASHVAEKIFKAFERPFSLNQTDYQISASIGLAIFDEQCHDPLEVIKQAELAMYEAKSSGRSRYCFYQTGMQERVLERVQLESDLRQALVNDEFTLHVQPQWDTQRKMIGAEALLRWQHPERGLVSPGIFIPLAEETRLILPIGEWVLRTACQWLSEWRLDETMNDFILSVNVSAVQFSQEDFVQQVQRILGEYDVAAGSLQLELTESMLAHDQQDIITKMSELNALGVLISLDDFGTGYSSLSYLHQLPIDQLKIDQSFVANIEQSEKNASLAESIISLGHNLGIEVIAEGVETEAQFTWLAEQGCDLFQGFGLAKPMSITELLDSLK